MLKVYPGPYGTCPDCKKPTPIRLNSLIASVKTKSWDIDPMLVRDILASVKAHAREGKTTIQKKVKKVGDDGQTRDTTERTKVSGTLAYCSKCARPANRLFWIEIGKALTEPFCKYCLSEEAKKIESQDGVVPNVPVYSYSTTLLSVSQALLVFEHRPEPPQSGVTMEGGSNEDLF